MPAYILTLNTLLISDGNYLIVARSRSIVIEIKGL
jgi:hypothetical protein